MKRDLFIKKRNIRLAATVDIPKENTQEDTFVIIFLGWESYRVKRTYASFQNLCHRLGLASITFDFRGHGESSGNIKNFNLVKAVEDTNLVLEWITAKHRNIKRFVIIAVSFSAEVALLVSEKDDRVKKLILVSGGFGKGLTKGVDNNYRKRYWDGVSDLIGISFKKYEKKLRVISIPVTLIHGSEDERVPPNLSRELKRFLVNAKVDLHIVEGANHKFDGFKRKRLQYIEKSLSE